MSPMLLVIRWGVRSDWNICYNTRAFFCLITNLRPDMFHLSLGLGLRSQCLEVRINSKFFWFHWLGSLGITLKCGSLKLPAKCKTGSLKGKSVREVGACWRKVMMAHFICDGYAISSEMKRMLVIFTSVFSLNYDRTICLIKNFCLWKCWFASMQRFDFLRSSLPSTCLS